jgi:PAS domain S-box-containing protein
MGHVPIIMLTALEDRRSRLRGLEAGADDFISKPIDAAELRARIRTISQLNRFRALAEERERFVAALTHSPDGIVIADEAGKIHFANAAFSRMLDPVHWAEGQSHRLFDAFPPERVEAFAEFVANSSRPTKHPVAFETALAHSKVSDTLVEITVGSLTWAGQRALQFNVRDITDKKRLEAQLLRSQRLELLGQISSGIVHDVNNILAAVLGTAQLLQMEQHSDSARLLGNIESSAHRGVNLLRQLLTFARGSDGDLETIAPGGIVAEVTSLIRETFGREYTINFAAPDDLPLLLADPNQLHQILMNLCVNARDAMPGGGSLDLSAQRRSLSADEAAAMGGDARAGDFVVLAVRDNGTGIPPEVRARLFDPFFTTKAPDKGTGLGLATVMRLVRRHQGFVHLETEVGTGTCFHCFLPLNAGQPSG